ncbi:hypothetical protein JCM15124A_12910 [Prevotella falsenii]
MTLLITLGAMGEDGVLLQLKNGSIVGFAFSGKPTMVIGAMLEIRTTETTVSYDYNEVKRVCWGEVQPSGISSAKDNINSNVVFRINANGLNVSGLPNGERVSVYDTTGKLVATAISKQNDVTLALPMKQSGGIYIARTQSGVSFKFTR